MSKAANKRPSFQFYVGDYLRNANLSRCSFHLRGIWIHLLCILHDQPEYGISRWPLKELARAAGCKLSDLKELVEKNVLKGSDVNSSCDEYVYTPRHGRTWGSPVILIEKQQGPIWYSSRMVKDEYVRLRKAGNIPSPNLTPMPPFGAVSSSSTSSSTSSSASAILKIEDLKRLLLLDSTCLTANKATEAEVSLFHQMLQQTNQIQDTSYLEYCKYFSRWLNKQREKQSSKGSATITHKRSVQKKLSEMSFLEARSHLLKIRKTGELTVESIPASFYDSLYSNSCTPVGFMNTTGDELPLQQKQRAVLHYLDLVNNGESDRIWTKQPAPV